MADSWTLDTRSVESLAAMLRWFQARNAGGPHTPEYRSQILSPVGGGQLRRAALLTDLDLGGTCTIQEYTYDANGDLCTVGESMTAHDPLGELQGTGGITCCIFQVPTSDPNGLAEIIRVTCPNFACVLCNPYYYYYYY